MTLPVPRSSRPPRSWDPFREFEDLYEQMGQLMQSTFRSIPDTAWVPLADLSETEDAYVVEVDLPGVKRDDVNVEVNGNELAINGEIKERERTGWFRHRTRRTGRFEYRTTLPRDVDADEIEATMTEGVLTVRVPKSEQAKPRRIQITEG